jgi:hypothetical protein
MPMLSVISPLLRQGAKGSSTTPVSAPITKLLNITTSYMIPGIRIFGYIAIFTGLSICAPHYQ